MKNPPYTCFCCGYATSNKSNMISHFYKRKSACPKTVNNVELTEEIKQHILSNRVYIPPAARPAPPGPKKVVNITNYNTINNFVCSLDPVEKVKKYIGYNDIKLIDFESSVSDIYHNRARKLDTGKVYPGFKLTHCNFLEIISEISSICDGKLENLNIIYDQKMNHIKLYDEGRWQEYLLATGLYKIIVVIQDAYLDSYEIYLIKKYHFSKGKSQALSLELVQTYYKFIGCFDVEPVSKDKSDGFLLNGEDDDKFDLSEKFWDIYNKISMTRGEVNKIRKDVLDIIKRNSNRNIEEINKRIMELIHVNEEFKADVLKRIACA